MKLEQRVGTRLRRGTLTVAVAESCTGGLIGARLTSVSGSSDYFRGGVIAYANDVKVRMAGVDPAALQQQGAVSAAVARQLAQGARQRFGADVGIGVTGIAGPGGGTARKPVGLVFIGVADRRGATTRRFRFAGARAAVRRAAVAAALAMLEARLERIGRDRRVTRDKREQGGRDG